MTDEEGVGIERRRRRRRSVAEKLQIVRLTMEPGASVAEIARAHELNANQLFKWRRLVEKGQLIDAGARPAGLIPVTISADAETGPERADAAFGAPSSSRGAIHIELPGRAMISVEGGVDPVLPTLTLKVTLAWEQHSQSGSNLGTIFASNGAYRAFGADQSLIKAGKLGVTQVMA